MAKRFDDLGLPGWVSDGLRRVLGTDAEGERLNDFGWGGVPPAAQLGIAVGSLGRNYRDMLEAGWKGGDKYFHCKGHCEAAKAGSVGVAFSKRQGDVREERDQRVKGYPPEDAQADQDANATGRAAGIGGLDCRQACAVKRPNGLPERY
ncbi:MAG: hypothetical protein Q8S47_17145 [Phenylobacterium sp.]|nr:hypothetical protein [Phenylobacterium sp.]